MKTIHLINSRNRNTRVVMETGKTSSRSSYTDDQGQAVESARFVKNSLKTDLKTLTSKHSLEALSLELIDSDPELDLELFGKQVRETSRIYLNSANDPASGVSLKEIVHLKDGSVKETRDFQDVEANINTEKPLKCTKLFPKKAFLKKFAFGAAYQITHIDGMTFDFLYDIAKELDEKKSFMYLGAGDKANMPLILSRNSSQYRAFLEGRVDGERYMLILHLTNLELKALNPEGE